ncbi:hypothetical protein [Fibrella aquatica]|uniref:hypothetical protein n=1 Tax=Fibrella aquatica TaxID=3242487 RepID=UPI003521C7D9
MIGKSVFLWAASALITLLSSELTLAQKVDATGDNDLAQLIRVAPQSIFNRFREAGMKPVNHVLTPAQKAKVSHAFALLPPVHQQILKEHLYSISFMDGMPNTALTSPIDSSGLPKRFTITFRAGLLDETISEWATAKENTCFSQVDKAQYTVRVEGGNMDAIIYVLMHEATHIVDAVKEITPHPAEANSVVDPTRFTKDIWHLMNVPADTYLDSLLEQTRFRSGKTVPINLAPDVYENLSKTPFPSLYAMAAWFEDLAELATIYHLTTRLNQPFHVVVMKDNTEVARFEPMKNLLIKQRLDQLAIFYAH